MASLELGFQKTNLPFLWGTGARLIQCYLGPRVSLPNGISFCPTALGGCTSMTGDNRDILTHIHTHVYKQTDRPCYGNVVQQERSKF